MGTLSKEAISECVKGIPHPGEMRVFETGATRDQDTNKLDYEGFLSPTVLQRYAKYMHKHRKQADGNLRDSDNWQKGIPQEQYIKSAFRHFMEWWTMHRNGVYCTEDFEDAICALIFNAMGFLHEEIKRLRTINGTAK